MVWLQMASKKKSTPKVARLSVTISQDSVALIDREATLNGYTGKTARSQAVMEIVRKNFRGKFGDPKTLRRHYDELLGEAKELKDTATELKRSHRGIEEASRNFLMAAAKELEALAMVQFISQNKEEHHVIEETMRSALIEIVGLIKDGTGYTHLPDVPKRKPIVNPSA